MLGFLFCFSSGLFGTAFGQSGGYSIENGPAKMGFGIFSPWKVLLRHEQPWDSAPSCPLVPIFSYCWNSFTIKYRPYRHAFRSCLDFVIFSRQSRNSKADKPQPQFRDQQYFHSHSSTDSQRLFQRALQMLPRHLMRHNLIRQLIVNVKISPSFQSHIQTVQYGEIHETSGSALANSMPVAFGPSVTQFTFSAKKKHGKPKVILQKRKYGGWSCPILQVLIWIMTCQECYTYLLPSLIKAQFHEARQFIVSELGRIDL